MIVSTLPRVFFYEPGRGDDPIELPDPNADMSIERVQSLFAVNYPEISTAKVRGPIFNSDKVEYHFTISLGQKG
ncbi:PRTRC system protein C [Chitinophaga arvensicola]|uniref:PRTRC system protein C n=1 Tax=Chitinophaga arvensicola TaxID=29529 RepID=A0A1I0PQ56_9BACT|nr:PRTRC system protein C [Chitinophaga arvensicola]SEW16401.1 PRTRC system protein C [Chitinophaga arvensicola]